ncbi:MAG: transglutaminase family protein [Planctomycetota bacterium]
MAIRIALHHQTRYRYDRPVEMGPQVVRLRPAPHCRTPIGAYSMKVEVGPGEEQPFINWQQDPQSNYLARLVFPKPVTRFGIEIDLVADLTPINPFDFFLEDHAEEFPFEYERSLGRELRPYLEPLGKRACGPLFEEMFKSISRKKRRTVDFLVDVNQMVEQRLDYSLRYDPGVQTPEQTLKKGIGSCRDFAWLLVHLLRKSGLAARFVSGYSVQLVADEKPIEEGAAAGVPQDVTDLHAWAEVYLPGAGWVGLDATSGMMCGEGHFPLAASPDPGSAAPISGALSEAEVEFDYAMTINRVHEDPRVTKPYTDDQWDQINTLGQQIDDRLNAGDVRLTMGGEPTFVSIDDQEGETWNTAAVGGGKRQYADQLVQRLRNKIAPGSLLHIGQGKWYPGEPLPRWALGLYWRKDGKPMWSRDDLIADESKDYGYDTPHARKFLQKLTKKLGVSSRYVKSVYEDTKHYQDIKAKLPVNVTPQDNRLESIEDRERLKRVFGRGLNRPVGYVLPLKRVFSPDGPQWQSGLWMMQGPADKTMETQPRGKKKPKPKPKPKPTARPLPRGGRIRLIPGDSPVGLRLPLDRLPWVVEDEYPYVVEADPMHAATKPLPEPDHFTQGGRHRAARSEEVELPPDRHINRQEPIPAPGDRVPQVGESASWVIRSAICVEPREGRIYIFMPPVEQLEDYLHLVYAIEATAGELKMPVIIEGYTPPTDPRIHNLKVTPDPGVIEVNVHPAASWDELVDTTTTLYDAARRCRLGTEKFQLDGRHTGTGGGNHVVVGAATPLDSPFLRRPDLLRSLLGHWHNHPSLSYLFSGMFIGPTSQAPRVDEGRADATYELEIACGQIPDPGGQGIPPWLVDRVFRNLLTDLTGNTHRAEFCIDKLYSPDSATGRLGLVEFRGFEMPPHPRMGLTQALLLRALIAKFWESSGKHHLVRWGTMLHDRFLLPHFVEEDFKDVLEDLAEHGFAIDPAWYDAFFEFRFPRHGTYTCEGVTIELRQAIEPWLTLGEEATGQGTARYVDSSLERMQVKVTGLVGSVSGARKYAVAVNGQELPLTPTGRQGEFVAGLRYRAWQPPSCLHPTIPIHTPLTFDLIDTWSNRSIGGCTYHVVHPGGMSYETFPINALEAESRRVNRFFQHGHTPGSFQMRPTTRSEEMPVTLDLRRNL